MTESAMDMGVKEVVETDESTEFLSMLLERGILVHKGPLTCRSEVSRTQIGQEDSCQVESDGSFPVLGFRHSRTSCFRVTSFSKYSLL